MGDVETAVRLANALVLRESRGPGDMQNAMIRLEARYGLDRGLLWSLRYRKPKDILLGHWRRLVSAYEAECERQRRHYEQEAERARRLNGGTDAPLVRAAAALAGQQNKTTT